VIYLPWVGSLLSFAPLVGGPIPLVVSCRGAQINIARHDPVRRRRFAALVEALRQVARVHCVSADLARTVGDLGVDAARIRVIRPAVDTARFAPGADPDSHRPGGDRLRLVTVGRLHWKKGHEYALVALRRLLDRGVPAELTLIGDGPEHGRLAYTVRDLGLADRAILRGPLDRDGVRRQLLRSDLFLLTSLTEGLSNAALEAMACGLPVVSTAAGGMGEAITDGEEGLLVALRDPEAIAAACETLWRDPGRRLVMGASARRRVERDFDSRDQIEAFGSMLREVAASARPEGAG
jgi:glycosyltransferase involved in cell wall biosynthesis